MQRPIYHQLLNLIGRSREETTESLKILTKFLTEEPAKVEITEREYDYVFSKNGITMSLRSNTGSVEQICLHISTTSVRQASIAAYTGDLPYGIRVEDTEEEVELKCRGATMAVKDYRTDIDLRPLEVQFCFSTPNINQPGIGPRKLTMISIHKADVTRT